MMFGKVFYVLSDLLAYLDKAVRFPGVPHARLEMKLNAHGIRGVVSRWILEMTGR